jgi:G3E family GTPase
LRPLCTSGRCHCWGSTPLADSPDKPQAPEPTPVTVITGFLGSGKTTLLNALLRDPGLRDTAVLVNEFGAVGIDHLLVEALEDEDVVLLNAGCLCCTIRDDLVACLSSLYEKRAQGTVPAFRRVVIETTGLADPAPILHTLLGHETVRDRFAVEGIVTTVEAVHGARQLTEHGESVKQAAIADRLVVTKGDIAEPGAVEALYARLAAINPGAEIVEAVHGAVAAARLLDAGAFDPARKGADVARWLGHAAQAVAVLADDAHHGHDVSRHDDRIRSFSLHAEAPIEIHRFVAWVEGLLEAHGDRLLRLKGILDAAGSKAPIVVHGVQHIFHPLARLSRWPDGQRRSRIVIIARDLDPGPVAESFRRIVLGEG